MQVSSEMCQVVWQADECREDLEECCGYERTSLKLALGKEVAVVGVLVESRPVEEKVAWKVRKVIDEFWKTPWWLDLNKEDFPVVVTS